MPRITLTITEEEKQALITMAKDDLRDPQSEAVFLIRRELKLFGFVQSSNPSINMPASETTGKDKTLATA